MPRRREDSPCDYAKRIYGKGWQCRATGKVVPRKTLLWCTRGERNICVQKFSEEYISPVGRYVVKGKFVDLLLE